MLPALASTVRTVNNTENEALILMGDTGALAPDASATVADYCQLVTHKGKITVGLSGMDNYVQEPGMWKRLGEFLAGRGWIPAI